MLSLLDMKFAGALERVRASVVRDDIELLWNVARSRASISVCLNNMDGAPPVESDADTANPGCGDQRRLRERQ